MGQKKYLKSKMAESFSNLVKYTVLQIQEAKQSQIKVNINQTMVIIVKHLKNKGKEIILKRAIEK